MGQVSKQNIVTMAVFLDIAFIVFGAWVGNWLAYSDLIIEIHEMGHVNSMAFNEGGTPYVERTSKVECFLRGTRTPEQEKRFTLAGYAAERFFAILCISIAMVINRLLFKRIKCHPMLIIITAWFISLYYNIIDIPWSTDFSYYPEEIEGTIISIKIIIGVFSGLTILRLYKDYKKLNIWSSSEK